MTAFRGERYAINSGHAGHWLHITQTNTHTACQVKYDQRATPHQSDCSQYLCIIHQPLAVGYGAWSSGKVTIPTHRESHGAIVRYRYSPGVSEQSWRSHGAWNMKAQSAVSSIGQLSKLVFRWCWRQSEQNAWYLYSTAVSLNQPDSHTRAGSAQHRLQSYTKR